MTFEKPNSATESSWQFSRAVITASLHAPEHRSSAACPVLSLSSPDTCLSHRAWRKATAAALTALHCKGLPLTLRRFDDKLTHLWEKRFWQALSQGCSEWAIAAAAALYSCSMPRVPKQLCLTAATAQLSVKARRGNAKTKTDMASLHYLTCLLNFFLLTFHPLFSLPCLLFLTLPRSSFT